MLIATAVFCIASPGRAALIELHDRNASLRLATASSDAAPIKGVYDWDVDGADRLRQHWFWYRLGDSGPEQSIDALPSIHHVSDTNPFDDPRDDTVAIKFTGAGFTLTVTYTLRGEAFGNSNSDLSIAALSIANTGATPLNIHLFHYADFNLFGSGSADTVQILDGHTAYQTNGHGAVRTDVTALASPRYEAGLYDPGDPNTILSRLTDAAADSLGPAIAGPVAGDVAWAFQWDLTIAVGGSWLLSENNVIHVPEPGTISLLLAGGLGLAAVRRRGKRAGST